MTGPTCFLYDLCVALGCDGLDMTAQGSVQGQDVLAGRHKAYPKVLVCGRCPANQPSAILIFGAHKKSALTQLKLITRSAWSGSVPSSTPGP